MKLMTNEVSEVVKKAFGKYLYSKFEYSLPLYSLRASGKGKVVLIFFSNQAPLHGGVLGKWKYSSMHS
jgi:hypothetical protein